MEAACATPAAAVNAARQAIKLSPDGMGHRYYLCLVLITQQRFDEAIAIAQADPADWSRLGGLAEAYRAAGRAADSEPFVQELIQKRGDIVGMQVAISYAVNGEIEATVKWLGARLCHA